MAYLVLMIKYNKNVLQSNLINDLIHPSKQNSHNRDILMAKMSKKESLIKNVIILDHFQGCQQLHLTPRK